MNKNNKVKLDVIPSLETQSDLTKLSSEFKPTDVKFLLALNSDFSREEYMAEAKGMTERLKRFIENDHSVEKAGLDPQKYQFRIL